MGFAWFFYTTVIIVVAVVSCSVSLVVWLMTHRRDTFVAASGFLLYTLETALIFYDEYARAKNDYAVTFDLPLTHPWMSCLLGIAVVGCTWLWTVYRTHARLTWVRALLPIAIFALLQATLVPRGGAASKAQQYLYWLSRDLAIAGCLAFSSWRYRHRASGAERLDMDRSRTFFKIACLLTTCVILEDTIMIMVYRPSGAALESSFFWYLTERNISENVLMASCSAQLLRRYGQLLSVYARHPQPDTRTDDTAARIMAQDDLTSKLALFGEAHRLSEREVQVLELAVRGLDAQNMASRLILAPGTVKAHLHRVYKKTGVASRAALIDAFWRE